eukprot:365768-Chlamydomonas_euryale.AAC.4
MYASDLLPVLENTGLSQPIDSFLEAASEQADWLDLLPAVRDLALTYGGQRWAMPVNGNGGGMYLRRDLFEKAGLGVPTTWDDLLIAANIINGTDIDGDGHGDYSFCLRKYSCVATSQYVIGQLSCHCASVHARASCSAFWGVWRLRFGPATVFRARLFWLDAVTPHMDVRGAGMGKSWEIVGNRGKNRCHVSAFLAAFPHLPHVHAHFGLIAAAPNAVLCRAQTEIRTRLLAPTCPATKI